MYNWISDNKDLWLTLDDFDMWPINQSYDVAMFDRNFEEMGSIWGRESRWKQDIPYSPKDLFSGIRTRVTKLGGHKWLLEIDGEITEHNVEVNITFLREFFCRRHSRSNICKNSFKELRWTPLCNSKLFLNKNKIMDADDMPGRTYIGWRGPMIFWADVESDPDNVFFSTSAESFEIAKRY